jgi:hypothetical protein
MKFYSLYISMIFISLSSITSIAQVEKADLVIIGGGASGTTAGIQAARMGLKTIIVEKTEWLGGMLTAAGVSAIDGNHQMPSGLWGEFRQKLYDYYGGPEAVETGWVSNTLFEPSVGNRILKDLAGKEKNLEIWYKSNWKEVQRVGELWKVKVQKGSKKHTIESKLIIDATELGDIMAYLDVPYSIGMDSRYETGEEFAPEQENDIIQDLTYVAILKDYGKGSDKTISKPEGYNKEEFHCACDVSDPASDGSPDNDCYQMMQYGRLPNNKYMINWPKCGNDIYLNIIEKSPAEREKALKEAKQHTLRFIYYLQTELGFRNLGIAEDEFPTKDNLPMIPYHRESRRLNGIVTLTVNHVADPYGQKEAFYRTGVAVGDYPIDHHHLKNPEAPKIDFIKIKVPSYNVPLGALIPQDQDGLIVAEKSISVTNIVNGATRLQPVVLGLGQAAGALAAVSVRNNIQPKEVDIREVQQELLNAQAYIMPFIDVKPEDPDFAAIQRIGATGILKGEGVPYKWANQTWFYPERPLSEYELISRLQDYYAVLQGRHASGSPLTIGFLAEAFKGIDPDINYNTIISQWPFKNKVPSRELKVSRRMAAVLMDIHLDPFSIPVNFDGSLKGSENQKNKQQNIHH